MEIMNAQPTTQKWEKTVLIESRLDTSGTPSIGFTPPPINVVLPLYPFPNYGKKNYNWWAFVISTKKT